MGRRDDFLVRGSGRSAPSVAATPSYSGPFVIPLLVDQSSANWTNMPAIATEFLALNTHRAVVDLSNASEVRLSVYNAGASGAVGSKLYLQYHPDLTETTGAWADLSTSSEEPASPIVNKGNIGAWAPIAVAAKGIVLVRIMGKGGDGVIDPGFGRIYLLAR